MDTEDTPIPPRGTQTCSSCHALMEADEDIAEYLSCSCKSSSTSATTHASCYCRAASKQKKDVIACPSCLETKRPGRLLGAADLSPQSLARLTNESIGEAKRLTSASRDRCVIVLGIVTTMALLVSYSIAVYIFRSEYHGTLPLMPAITVTCPVSGLFLAILAYMLLEKKYIRPSWPFFLATATQGIILMASYRDDSFLVTIFLALVGGLIMALAASTQADVARYTHELGSLRTTHARLGVCLALCRGAGSCELDDSARHRAIAGCEAEAEAHCSVLARTLARIGDGCDRWWTVESKDEQNRNAPNASGCKTCFLNTKAKNVPSKYTHTYVLIKTQTTLSPRDTLPEKEIYLVSPCSTKAETSTFNAPQFID